MHKSYNEIVATCKLLDYIEELAGKFSVFCEYWEDDMYIYSAIFSPLSDSFFPHTYTKESKCL